MIVVVTTPPLSASDEARWNQKVLRSASGCWLWIGALTVDGYGMFSLKSRNYPAHRLAYILRYGQPDSGMLVRHTCDVRNCVNADHLVCGTTKSNAEDKVLRGRIGGETHSQAKLTKEQIVEIFGLRKAGRTCISIGNQFGVSRQLVSFIGTGRHHWFELGLKPRLRPAVRSTAKYQITVTRDEVERFWRRVEKTETCWCWSGCSQRGYGVFRCAGKTHKAHRVSYVINNGPIPTGKVISHTCANRICVRPKHLQAVTAVENMANPITRRRLSEAWAANHKIPQVTC